MLLALALMTLSLMAIPHPRLAQQISGKRP